MALTSSWCAASRWLRPHAHPMPMRLSYGRPCTLSGAAAIAVDKHIECVAEDAPPICRCRDKPDALLVC